VRRYAPALPWLVFAMALFGGLGAYCLSGLLSGHDIDETVYYLAARAWLTGHRPYLDYVYTQPPLSMLLVMPGALVDLLTGREELGFAIGRMLSTVALAGTATLVWCFFYRRWGAPIAAAAAALLTLFDITPAAVGHSIMLEPWINLMTLLALLAALDKRMLLAASIAAIAALTKSQGALAVVPFLAVGIVRRDWPGLGRGCALIVGIGGITLAVGTWLTQGEFLQQVILFQFARPAEHTLAEQAGLIGWMLNPAIVVTSAAGLLGLAGVPRAINRDTPATIGLLAWLAAALVLVSHSYSFYYHYWAQVSLPLAMAAGFLFVESAPWRMCRARWGVVAGLAALLMVEQISWHRYRSGDTEIAALRADAAGMASAGFDPTGWANIVLGRPLISAGGKLVIDAYATKQYLDLRPFTIAHCWSPYTWSALASEVIEQSDWIWTDPRGERVLLPDHVALRESIFSREASEGEYRLYDHPLIAATA
jgi:hypothetical protein